MHRIDGANSNPTGHFSEGDPMVPRPPTSLNAAWCEAVQEEIAKVIESAGITLETSGTETNDQLLAALRLAALFVTNASPFFGSANAGKVRTYKRPGLDGTNGARFEVTINAAWDSGSSEWVPDSATSPSLMLRMSAGSAGGIAPSAADIGLYRNDSGASFVDSAWVRGVAPVHGLAYGTHWSDAGGSTSNGRYRIDAEGSLRLSGVAANDGTAGTVATLPSGFRPATQKLIPCLVYNGSAWVFGFITIATNGDITVGASGSGVLLYLDGITFPLVD